VTRSLPALTSNAIEAIITAVSRKTSPHSSVNWHHFHGVGNADIGSPPMQSW
jgi:hypothetical protein